MSTTRQWDFKIQCFGRQYTVFPDFLRPQNMVRVMGQNFIKNDLMGTENWFELAGVRVMEGKITVNIWRKSRGNRFWFELA